MPRTHLEIVNSLTNQDVGAINVHGRNRAGETLMAKAVRDDLSTDFLLPFPGVSLEVTQNRTVTCSPDVLERWAQLAALTTMLDSCTHRMSFGLFSQLAGKLIDYMRYCPQHVLSELMDGHVYRLFKRKKVGFLVMKHLRACAVVAATNPAATTETVDFAVHLPKLRLDEVTFLMEMETDLTDDMWEHLMFEQGFQFLSSHENCPQYLADLWTVLG